MRWKPRKQPLSSAKAQTYCYFSKVILKTCSKGLFCFPMFCFNAFWLLQMIWLQQSIRLGEGREGGAATRTLELVPWAEPSVWREAPRTFLFTWLILCVWFVLFYITTPVWEFVFDIIWLCLNQILAVHILLYNLNDTDICLGCECKCKDELVTWYSCPCEQATWRTSWQGAKKQLVCPCRDCEWNTQKAVVAVC